MRKEIKNLDIRKETIDKIISSHTHDSKLKFRLIKSNLNPELVKRVLFSLFTENYQKELITLEKDIRKLSKKIKKETGWQVVNRNEIIYCDEGKEKVYRLIREKENFYPAHQYDTSIRGEHEYRFWLKHSDLADGLADKIVKQKLLVDLALLVGLKNITEKEFATILANYLDLLPEEELKNPIKFRQIL